MSSDHTVWTVASTAYLRNLDEDDRRGECIAVHYQAPPKHDPETRTTSLSMRFPTLIVSLYAGQPREVADRVAAILNAHWDSFELSKQEPKACDMGVGCDEYGTCYAAAHGAPERCPREVKETSGE